MAGMGAKGKPGAGKGKPAPKKEKGDKPKVVIRAGNLKVSCWENKGDFGIWYSCKLARIYKTDDEWKQTDHLNDSDLPAAAVLLQTAFIELALRKGGGVHVEGEEDGEQRDGNGEGEGGGNDEPDIPY